MESFMWSSIILPLVYSSSEVGFQSLFTYCQYQGAYQFCRNVSSSINSFLIEVKSTFYIPLFVFFAKKCNLLPSTHSKKMEFFPKFFLPRSDIPSFCSCLNTMVSRPLTTQVTLLWILAFFKKNFLPHYILL